VAALLSLRGVTLGYERGREVLRGVSLDVDSGALACVVGANGTGKTTLLRAMSGTLTPLSGEVSLEGRSLSSMRRDEIARVVAVVPQDLPTVDGFSVREVVAMGRAPHQGRWMRASTHDEEIVSRAMQRCSVDALADRPFDALSGGERKRATIAQALAQEPKLLLLDEPSAFLDVRHALQIFELLAAEVARGLAVVANVHDVPLAARFADRVVVLARGSVVASGAASEVLTPAALRDAFDVEWIDAGGALLPSAYAKR
jgi:iron complex transport system ATP-binding protein